MSLGGEAEQGEMLREYQRCCFTPHYKCSITWLVVASERLEGGRGEEAELKELGRRGS